MRWVLSLKPPDLVDLLLDLQALEVVELWLVALEGAVHVVLPPPGMRRLGLEMRKGNKGTSGMFDTLSVVADGRENKTGRSTLTAGSLWKMTTLPPLSPVARRSPSWLNSTHEMMSASVTSSSRVPFTWEKHHWMSLDAPETEK